tara:strand:- start:360 stop:533 length:174 start_codon:yes stop_codon:yes gene_type:complete
MARYKVEFESPPILYIDWDGKGKLRHEVVDAWVSYSWDELPDYKLTEVEPATKGEYA